MNFRKVFVIFHSRSFLIRFFILTLLLFILIIVAYSTVLYYNTKTIFFKTQFENNSKSLEQIQYTIDYMDNTIKSFCKTLYTNADTYSLMYDKNLMDYEKFEMANKLFMYTNANPFIHSVFIYNNSTKEYYSICNNIYFRDLSLEKLITEYNGNIPRLRLISRKMDDEVQGKKVRSDVFTYIIYEDVDTDNMPKGALIVNIRPQWIIQNVRDSGNFQDESAEKVFIVNKNNEFINNEITDENLKTIIIKYCSDHRIKERSGYIVSKINNEKYIITYLNINYDGLFIVKIQKFDRVFNLLSDIQRNALILVIACIIITVFVLLPAIIRIYSPIGRLINSVSSDEKQIKVNNEKDEISYLNTVYMSYKDKINNYQSKLILYGQPYKMQVLKSLVLDNKSVTSRDEWIKMVENTLLRFDECFAILLVKIDDYDKCEKIGFIKDKQNTKYMIGNVFSEMMSECFNSESIDMDDEKIVFLFNVNQDEGPEAFYKRMGNLYLKTLKHIEDNLGICISATVSRPGIPIENISEEYEKVLSYARYKYIFGKRSFIYADKVEEYDNNPLNDFSKEYEKKLIESVKLGNLQATISNMEVILQKLSTLNYSNIMMGQIKLLNIITSAVKEVNGVSLMPTQFDIKRLSFNIFKFETISDFKYELEKVISEWMHKREEKVTTEKRSVLIDSIREIVDKNYSNRNLCLDYIAEKLKMSPQYLGRIFKDAMGRSIIEYINGVRVDKAAELLESKDYNISKIMEITGLENESYFYKLFKKKNGITPKEYAKKKSMNS